MATKQYELTQPTTNNTLLNSNGKGKDISFMGSTGTQIVSSHNMENLIRKGALMYVKQCQEMELLTLEVVYPSHQEIQKLIQK